MPASRMANRRGQVWLMAVVAIAILIAAVAVWLAWRPAAMPQPDTEEGRKVCEEFLTQIQDGHADEAWESTTAEFKSAEGREAFRRYVKQHPFLTKPLDFVSAQTVSVNDQPRTEYLFRAPDGKASARLITAREDDAWRVDRLMAE